MLHSFSSFPPLPSMHPLLFIVITAGLLPEGSAFALVSPPPHLLELHVEYLSLLPWTCIIKYPYLSLSICVLWLPPNCLVTTQATESILDISSLVSLVLCVFVFPLFHQFYCLCRSFNAPPYLKSACFHFVTCFSVLAPLP